MGEPGVAQSGRKIEGADHLRAADAGLARGARVAIGHIGGRFLAVDVQALDVGAAFHLGECGAHDGRHVEDVRDLIALEHVGDALRAGHFAVVADLHGRGFLTLFSLMFREGGASIVL